MTTICVSTVKLDAFAVEEPNVIAEVVLNENNVTENTQLEKTMTAGEGTITVSGNDAEVILKEQVIEEKKQDTINTEYSVLEQSNVAESLRENSWDGSTTEAIYETENYKITFKLFGYWDSGYNANVKIENIGDELIENWYIEFDFDNTISNVWNAEIHNQKDGKYIIGNVGWNADIATGESVEFGFIGTEQFKGFPKVYTLLGEDIEVIEEDYSVQYSLINDWGNGYTGEIQITNNTDDVLENWFLEFDYNRTINEIWNGILETHEGNHFCIKNAGYNQNILPGQSIIIGFCGEDGENTDKPVNYRLVEQSALQMEKAVTISKDNLVNIGETFYYLSNEDASLNGYISSVTDARKAYCIIKNFKSEVLKTLDISVSAQWSIVNVPLVVGENEIEVIVEYVDGTICTDTVVIWNFDESKMEGLDIDLSDTDEDKLVNYLEDIYGTDKELPDTDADGISDYNELIYLGTDPTIQDTNYDGVLDGRDDADNDKISSYDEFLYGTDPSLKDSDGDMLDDYIEIFTYNTNPQSHDTDEDGADDLWELENGTDPLIYNESFLVSEISNNGVMELKVELSVKGEQASTLTVENNDNNYLINETIPGYLGTAFDLHIEGSFENANITITFDEEFLGIDEFNPTLYYFNESAGVLEEIVTKWDGKSNVVYATLEHFSKYILLNKTEFDKVWDVEFDNSGEISVGKEIVLAIDASGSMGPQGVNNDPKNIRLDVAKKFVEKLQVNDVAAVISFEENIKVLSVFTRDKEVLYSAIDLVGNTGPSTYIGAAISKSIELFGDKQTERERYIILLTDGHSDDSMPSYQEKCQKSGIKIYTIGLGSYLDTNLMRSIATNTGGKYYHASVANDLKDIFVEVENEIIDDKTSDGNSDKITDYNTKLMFDGTLRTGTGTLVFPGVTYEEFQKKSDFDEDGLLNGEEVTVVNGEMGTYVSIITDPLNADTDGDSYNDYAEINNFKSNPVVYDIITSDMNYFTNNDLYMSSLFSEEYLESDWLQFQLFMGNALLNFRVDYTNAYKAALYDYIRVLSEVSVEELALSDLISQTSLDIYETSNAAYNWVNFINAIPDDTLKVANHSQTIIDSTNELLALDARLAKVNSMKEADDIIISIVEEKTKIQAEYMTIMTEYNRNIKKYDTHNLSGKMAERVGNIMYKLPDKLKSSITAIGKLSFYGDYIMVGIDTATNVANSVQAFSVINAENMNYEKAFLMLEAIINNSENEEMRAAATDIKFSIYNQYYQFISNAEMIYEDVARGALEASKIAIIAELGPLAWAIDMGISLGDMAFNTGEVDELSLYTIAVGDAAVSISKEIEEIVITDTQLFYLLTDDVREQMEVLSQLRIVGENKFYEASDARSFILKLFTGSQSEIEEVCKDNIMSIFEKSYRHRIYANPHYDGHVVSLDE